MSETCKYRYKYNKYGDIPVITRAANMGIRFIACLIDGFEPHQLVLPFFWYEIRALDWLPSII
jgi:hypothetical protein